MVTDQVSLDSKGKQRLSLVLISMEGGISEGSFMQRSGAIGTGKVGSSSEIINPGHQEAGLFLSPRDIKRENLSLNLTSLPIGRSFIGRRLKVFA